MFTLSKGRYQARLAEGGADIAAAQTLRGLCFRGGAEADADGFDAACTHVLIEERTEGRLVACFRLMPLKGGCDIAASYSAQYYELSALSAFEGPMVEMGRFCIHPDWSDADILRVAWGALTQYVDAEGVEMLFGCSSFKGAEGEAHREAFDWLTERHLAPKRWLPRVKAPRVFRFAERRQRRRADRKRAMLGMPPLLRTYLAMGGWVSDHAVVDADLDTLHVFTGLEIRAIPPARARLLRATVG